eukprot:Skav236143  [mRNA]  locus=scaffold88:160432:161139:- [translate_table: standard]
MAPCTYLHGWFPELPGVIRFAHALNQHDQPILCEPFPASPGASQLFVDGACQRPRDGPLRLATWSVAAANLDTDEFAPIGHGALHGMLHSSLRAEIVAATVAVEAAASANRAFMLWTDNQVVHDRLVGWIAGHGKQLTRNSKDLDLWTRLHRATQLACHKHLFHHVIKVRSHENIAAYSEQIEVQALRGNWAGDALATQAVRDAPACIRGTWERACAAYDAQAVLRDSLQNAVSR